MGERYYTFFDTTLVVNLPEEIQADWDLLYGAFEDSSNRLEKTYRIELRAGAGDHIKLMGHTVDRDITHETAMMHLQDVAQNEVIGSVSSHHLYHGACWRVDDRGLVLLAESGIGKSTLSLAHMVNGGSVMSDEIAAWNPATSRIETFPRSMAVRPASMRLCHLDKDYPVLHLDEDKTVIPLPSVEESVPVGAVVFLTGQKDDASDAPFSFELCVMASDEAWIDALKGQYQGLRILSHPDGDGWYRCESKQPMQTGNLHEYIRNSGGVLVGFHRGSFRFPDYERVPAIERISEKEAAEAALSHMLNARNLVAASSPLDLMESVRAMMRGVACYRCIPGKLVDTVAMLEQTVS